jgi:hypothetical protein
VTLAIVRLAPHETGAWPEGADGLEVQVDGRRYRRTRWAIPQPGTVAHYRETVAKGSRHLERRADGTWRITHLDDHNPDAGAGRALMHLLVDTPIGLGAAALAAFWFTSRR